MTHEDIVTKLLSDKEIIGSEGELYDEDNKRVNYLYNTNPQYDISAHMKKSENEPGRWGIKYRFVK